MTMRAFVAVIPPEPVLAELDAVVAPLRVAHPDLRWTPRNQWHVTLAFLGEIDDGALPELGARVARAARRHPPIPLRLGAGGRFGERVLWLRVHPVSSLDAAPTAPTVAAVAAVAPAAPAAPVDAVHPVAPVDAAPAVRGCAAVGESCVSTGRVLHSDSHPRADGLRRLAASVTAAARRTRIAVDGRSFRPHLTLARARADLRPAVAALAGYDGSPWTTDALHLVRSRLGAGPGGTALHEVVETWTLGR